MLDMNQIFFRLSFSRRIGYKMVENDFTLHIARDLLIDYMCNLKYSEKFSINKVVLALLKPQIIKYQFSTSIEINLLLRPMAHLNNVRLGNVSIDDNVCLLEMETLKGSKLTELR
jgi:hypothetical protein